MVDVIKKPQRNSVNIRDFNTTVHLKSVIEYHHD